MVSDHEEKTQKAFAKVKEEIRDLEQRVNTQQDVIEDLLRLLNDKILTDKQKDAEAVRKSVGDVLDELYFRV